MAELIEKDKILTEITAEIDQLKGRIKNLESNYEALSQELSINPIEQELDLIKLKTNNLIGNISGVKTEKYVRVSQNFFDFSKIGYITICSSVAASGTQIRKKLVDTSGMKSALFGASEDVENIKKYLFSKPGFVNKATYLFSNEGFSSPNQISFFEQIRDVFDSNDCEGLLLFYSGHGLAETGDLLLEAKMGNYYITFEKIVELWKQRAFPKALKHLLIILDCCYSGVWVNKLLENGVFDNISVQASSRYDEKSQDLGSNIGGLFTNFFLSSNRFRNFNIDGYEKNTFKKALAQTPQAFGLKNIIQFCYELDNLIVNSWEEFISPCFPTVLNFEDKEKKIGLKVQMIKYSVNEKTLAKPFCHGGFIINEEIITGQSEIFVADNGSTSNGEKYILYLEVRSSEIRINQKGLLSFYEKDGVVKSKYFNRCLSKEYVFELTPELNLMLIGILTTICSDCQKLGEDLNKYVKEMINIFSVLTEANTNRLISSKQSQDEAEEGENGVSLESLEDIKNEKYKVKRCIFSYGSSIPPNFFRSKSCSVTAISLIEVNRNIPEVMQALADCLTLRCLEISRIVFANQKDVDSFNSFLLKCSLEELDFSYSLVEKEGDYQEELEYYENEVEEVEKIEENSNNSIISPLECLSLVTTLKKIKLAVEDTEFNKSQLLQVFKIKGLQEFDFQFNMKDVNELENFMIRLSEEVKKSKSLNSLHLNLCSNTFSNFGLFLHSKSKIKDFKFTCNLDEDELNLKCFEEYKQNYSLSIITPNSKLHNMKVLKKFLSNKNNNITGFQLSSGSNERCINDIALAAQLNLRLMHLDLSNNALFYPDIIKDCLKDHKSLETLKAADCNLWNFSLVCFLQIFSQTSKNKIKVLDISGNSVSDADAFNKIAMIIRFNTNLERLIMNKTFSSLKRTRDCEFDRIMYCKTLIEVEAKYNNERNCYDYLVGTAKSPWSKKLKIINLEGTYLRFSDGENPPSNPFEKLDELEYLSFDCNDSEIRDDYINRYSKSKSVDTSDILNPTLDSVINESNKEAKSLIINYIKSKVDDGYVEQEDGAEGNENTGHSNIVPIINEVQQGAQPNLIDEDQEAQLNNMMTDDKIDAFSMQTKIRKDSDSDVDESRLAKLIRNRVINDDNFLRKDMLNNISFRTYDIEKLDRFKYDLKEALLRMDIKTIRANEVDLEIVSTILEVIEEKDIILNITKQYETVLARDLNKFLQLEAEGKISLQIFDYNKLCSIKSQIYINYYVKLPAYELPKIYSITFMKAFEGLSHERNSTKYSLYEDFRYETEYISYISISNIISYLFELNLRSLEILEIFRNNNSFGKNTMSLCEFLTPLIELLKIQSPINSFKALIIMDYIIDMPEIAVLIRFLNLVKHSIEQVFFINTSIDAKEASQFFPYLSCLKLKTFALQENLIGDEMAKLLIKYFKEETSLERIFLRNCSITNSNLLLILDSIKTKRLIELDISGIRIEGLANPNAEYQVSLCYNDNLLDMAMNFNTLQQIDFYYMDFSRKKNDLYYLFKNNPNLRKLKFCHCYYFLFYLELVTRNVEKIDLLDFSYSLITKSNYKFYYEISTRYPGATKTKNCFYEDVNELDNNSEDEENN